MTDNCERKLENPGQEIRGCISSGRIGGAKKMTRPKRKENSRIAYSAWVWESAQ